MSSHRSSRQHRLPAPAVLALTVLLAAGYTLAAARPSPAAAATRSSSVAEAGRAAAAATGRAALAGTFRTAGAVPPTRALTPVDLGAAAPRGPAPSDALAPSAGAASSPASYPLHTSGRWIENAQGQRVKLASVNWDGFESKEYVAGGLEHQSIDSVASWIASNGFNSVRIPWSNEMYEQNPVVDSKYLSANPGLDGEHALSILDTVINTLGQHGLMVILDNHQSDAGWCCSTTDGNGLWYNSGYPESSWIADWEGMAARYKNNSAVVGAELRNEIRANGSVQPVWGGGGTNDWHRAATEGGNAVLAANPNLLIVVDGLNYSTDFTGVASDPVVLSSPGHVVYAPHAYKQDYGGNSWSGWSSIQGYTTDSPAATEFDPSGSQPQLVVFARGTDGQVYEDTWSEPSGPWSGWHGIGGNITGAPAVAAFGQQVQVFGRGTDGQVWTDVWSLSTGTWSGWHGLGGNVTGAPAAAAFSPTGQDPQLQVFARGTDGLIYQDVWSQSSGWTNWHSIAGSGVTTGSPSAAAFGTGQMQLFAEGTDGAVWTDVWSLSPGSWGGWHSLGGSVTSSPSASAFGTDQMQVYARGTNGQVYGDVWTSPSGPWSGWHSIGGNVVGAPAATQFGSQMQVFAEGTDTQVYDETWNDAYQKFHDTIGSRWGYILTQGQSYTAPLWVSEWGTCITWVTSACDQTDTDFFDNITHYLRDGDIDFAYWQLGSEQLECGCSQRTYGALDYFGLMSYPDWSGAANTTALGRIQALQAPTQGP